MTYAVVEAAVAAVVRKVTGYTTANVGQGDALKLAAGVARAAMVYRGPGGTSEPISLGNPRTVRNVWTVVVDVYVPGNGRSVADTQAALQTEVDSVKTELEKWPRLDAAAGVVDAVPSVGAEEPMVAVGEMWLQPVYVTVTELETVTASE